MIHEPVQLNRSQQIQFKFLSSFTVSASRKRKWQAVQMDLLSLAKVIIFEIFNVN